MEKTRVHSLGTPAPRAVALLLSLSGCSFLYDLSTQQCSAATDCRRMGPQFEHASCVNRVCVASTGLGGAEGFAGSGPGGSSGDLAGAAGSSSPSACSNDTCIKEHGNGEWICRDNACVPLTTDDCPIVIPRGSSSTLLKQQDVIVIGAFAAMDNSMNFFDSQAIVNWTLALNEFNTETWGGLPKYGDGTQRPIVGVVCRGSKIDTDTVVRSVQHLTETVQVPAILSTLSPSSLYQAWLNQHPLGSVKKDVFFMSTSSADAQLANLSDGGLVWHMLGDPRSLAAPIATLLRQVEPVVNRRRAENFAKFGVDDPRTEPLRVTLVSSDEPILADIAEVLTSVESTDRPGTMLRFNGLGWAANGDNARWARILSGRQNTTADVSPVIAEIAARPPHVIVAMTGAEFPEFAMDPIEQLWTDAGANTLHRVRPTYIMSHLSYNSAQLLNAVKAHTLEDPRLDSRLIGANYASAQDEHSKALYDAYLARLKGSYQGSLYLDGTENFYDGAYYLLYSLAAAATVYRAPTGSHVADGLLERIISQRPTAVSVDVGPTPLMTTLGTLFRSAATTYFSLYGTMGAPNFDRLSGTRMSPMSAWCTQINARGVAWEYLSDGLLFDAVTRTFSRPTKGVPACLSDYCSSDTTEGGAVCH